MTYFWKFKRIDRDTQLWQEAASLSVFEVLLFEITTPSLLHSRLGTGEPRAAHCRVTFSKMFLTLRMEDGAVVITGGALRVKKGEKQNRWFILCQRQRYFEMLVARSLFSFLYQPPSWLRFDLKRLRTRAPRSDKIIQRPWRSLRWYPIMTR